MPEMTPRERFIAALKRQPLTGRVPTFELVFFLTMEAFGVVHHSQRHFRQWNQMSKEEQAAHYKSIAEMYVMTAEKYEHNAIFVHETPMGAIPILEQIREISGDKYFLMLHGDATYEVPDGNHMLDFTYRMADEPEEMQAEADERVKRKLEEYEKAFGNRPELIDGAALCADYCLNVGPFLSPTQFSEFVAPYLEKLIAGYRDMGIYTIKHSDGNIMPIIDQIVQCKPDALHSLDPQGGVSLAEVKRLYGDKVALCGNVNCGLLQTGTDEEVIADVRRSLREGMEGGPGYIFCTSNCVYTGMPLRRYEMMNQIWREEGNYPVK